MLLKDIAGFNPAAFLKEAEVRGLLLHDSSSHSASLRRLQERSTPAIPSKLLQKKTRLTPLSRLYDELVAHGKSLASSS